MVFHLPLRQTEGFLNSWMQLLDVDLPIPDHTTLSRRLQTLGEVGFQPATQGPLHLLIDSTGLRIHVGHLRKPPRNRAWRKLHLAVDAESGQIIASELTNHRIRDSTPVPALLLAQTETHHRRPSPIQTSRIAEDRSTDRRQRIKSDDGTWQAGIENCGLTESDKQGRSTQGESCNNASTSKATCAILGPRPATSLA